jgi:hypothetical protein
MKLNRRSLLRASAAIIGTAPLARAATAQALGADALGSTLTPLGGIRAGNADGTIPAWTGKLIPLPADYVSGTLRPDPFAGDKPLFTITAANMGDYKDKLSAGDIYLLQNHPDYAMNVYKTNRTAIAPQWVYDYTAQNAVSAQTTPDGNNLSGAYGGIPFPIPTTGKQVIWNHELRWLGSTISNPSIAWLVTSGGSVIFKNATAFIFENPYYFQGGKATFDGVYQELSVRDVRPAFMEGEAEVVVYHLNPLEQPPRGWAYLIGERRVRLAPQLQYDTPVDVTGGVVNWDEAQMFNGALDDYDMKIVGKKEMFVCYNNNKLWNMNTPDAIGPKHMDPAAVRWELHRVWVIDMTLAPGKRNVDTRRVAYVDEDTWTVLGLDIYDANGQLWKYHHAMPAVCSDIPTVSAGFFFNAYDFHAGSYVVFGGWDSPDMVRMQPIAELPPSYFTPGQLNARAGGS